MIKQYTLLFLAAVALSTGCNNQRNSRLSAVNTCDSGVRADDPSAFELTDREVESAVFAAMDPNDFPENEALAVRSIVTTFEVALENEEKAVVRVASTNPETSNISVPCIRNFDPSSKLEKTVSIPVNNKNGLLTLKKFKLVIGSPLLEDSSDFVRLEEITEEVAPTAESGNDTPVPFTDFFSEDGDELQFFKLAVPKDKEISEEDRLKESYFVHYRNDSERVRSRLTVSRIINADTDKN